MAAPISLRSEHADPRARSPFVLFSKTVLDTFRTAHRSPHVQP